MSRSHRYIRGRGRNRQVLVHSNSCPIVTYVDDSSDNEAEEMTPKPSPSLRELMKARNKAPSPQEANKSKPPVNPPPPPPQLPADLELKPNPELRRKRHQKVLEEGEVGL